MQLVVFLNGGFLLFLASAMAIVALAFPKTAGTFMLSAFIAGSIGAMLVMATWAAPRKLKRLHSFLVTATIWANAGLTGALPLYLWELDLHDAVFEAMSGITTTGATVMIGLDGTPHGILFWRAALQGLGGIGFIVTGVALLPFLKVGGMQLFRTESSEKGQEELARAGAFALASVTIYGLLIAISAMTYLMGGMSGFDAITHAMTSVSTGGYSNYDASFGHFDSAFLHWSAVAFMLSGSLPFAWYIQLIQRRNYHSEQVTNMLRTLTIAVVILTAWLVATTPTAPAEALRLVAFNVVSVVTTTGYATTDYTTWGPFAAAAFFVLTAVGGCTGSTSGGAKIMRWIVFLRATRAQVARIKRPRQITPVSYEGRTVGDDVVLGVISFFFIYFLTFAGLAMLLALSGLNPETALSGALTALANVGPGIGPEIGPAGNFALLNDTAKLLLVAGMYLGRLEMLTVYVLFTARYWRELA